MKTSSLLKLGILYLILTLVTFVNTANAQRPVAYASNPLMNVDSLSPSPELKTMLLQNLNKHSDGEDILEALGSSSNRIPAKSHSATKHSKATALPISLDLFKPMANNPDTTTISQSIDELPFDVVKNFFDEQTPISKPAIFAPDARQTPSTPLVGFGDILRPFPGFSLPTLPPFQPLPTLPPLITFPPINFLEDLARQQRASTFFPPLITTTSIPQSPQKTHQVNGPRFVNQSSVVSPEHVQMWRRRFYKVFKEIKNQFKKTVSSDSDEVNPLHAFKNDASWQNVQDSQNVQGSQHVQNVQSENVHKPVEEDELSMAQPVNNKPLLEPFPVEHSGYAYNVENNSNRNVNGNRDATFPASINKQRQNRTTLLSEFSPDYRSTTQPTQPVRLHVSNDYEEEEAHDLAPQVDDDTNFDEEPCSSVGCTNGLSGLWQAQKDADNRETCNSLRLKVLIESSIVGSDAEQSKRIIQTRTEAEFGTFYNVICGAGFFSYIAHTDEFCLASNDNMNCYVFSPVCTDNLGISSGLLHRNRRLLGLRRKALKKTLKRNRKAYVNRN